MKLSVVISTRNRADSLERTLRSVKGFADELIVVDNESTDETAVVAKRFGAHVFRRKNNLMLNANKNFGFSKASGDWILCLDDDEVVTQELATEIRTAMDDASHTGYWIPRKNMIFGKWIRHGIWWPDRQLRLFRRGMGRYAELHVHEYIEATGSTGTLSEPYVHHNYDTLAQYLDKMQRIYTENEVRKYRAAGYRVHWRDAIRFPASDFIKLYVAERGYRDGLHGLVLAVLQAFYSFIIFVKLWEEEQFREVDIPVSDAVSELVRSGRECAYWVLTEKMRETHNPLIRLMLRIRRKFTHVS